MKQETIQNENTELISNYKDTNKDDNILSLNSYLKLYPWNEEILKLGQPIEFLWTFVLNAPLEKLWEVLIDTSSFNKRLGLPPMEYKEVDGILHGKTKYFGIPTEWIELPWEWEYGKTLSNVRIYSKGLFSYVRSRYIFIPKDYNKTILHVYFGWIPKNWIGKVFIYIGMPRVQKLYRKVLKEIVQDIQRQELLKENIKNKSNIENEGTESQESLYARYFLKPKEEAQKLTGVSKLKEIADKLTKEGFDTLLIKKLITYVIQTPEEELYKIQVKKLAKEWGVSFTDVLRLFLYCCKYSLMYLSWDVVCPHCRGIRSELNHLGEIPKEASCDVCNIDFTTNTANVIEIVFHIHPSIRKVQKRLYCAAEPATKRHIYFQKILQPKETYETSIDLPMGIYRMRSGSSKDFSILTIGNANLVLNTEDSLQLNGEEVIWESSKPLQNLHQGQENLKLKLINYNQSPLAFVIESREEDQYALRAGEILSFKEFRSLFSDEYIQVGVILDVGVQSILFTDIVGSTNLYREYGDAKVFSEVKNHFTEIYKIVENNNGVVVKTIGDAAMVAFTDPIQALKSGIELQEFFQGTNNQGIIKIRISIHYGVCLGVNFNNGIDYFGNTVNFAAKLQKYSQAGDILISEDFYNLSPIKNYIRDLIQKYSVKKVKFYMDKEKQNERYAIKIHVP